MNALTRFILGLDETEAVGRDARWELSGLPEGPALFAAAIVVAAALALIALIYRRERGLRLHQRISLAALRVGALALIVLVLLNPRIVTELQNKRPGRTLVLADVSTSMEQRDRHEGDEAAALESATGLVLADRPTRTALMQAALERQGTLAALAEKNRVEVFTFGAGLARAADPGDGGTVFAPTAGETRLGLALRDLSREAGSDPVAGVVLLTDGRTNAGLHPLDLLDDPVRWRDMPVHVVGVGKVEDAKNYAVAELSGPPIAEVGYPIEIEGVVRLSGIRGPVKASLYRIEQRGSGKKLVEQRDLDCNGPLVETRLRFIDTVDRKGTYVYRLELPRREEETTQRDNRREVRVIAAEQKRRVLLVSELPTRLFQNVRDFFFRDDGVQVSSWLALCDERFTQDGNIVIRRLPRSKEELADYDVVVLIDPGPTTLIDPLVDALRDFVIEQGGGLVYVAGESLAPKVARDARLERFRALLPVTLNTEAPLLGANFYYTDPWRPLLTVSGQEHPICRLESEVDVNRELWERTFPFYFVHPTPRYKPAALVLLEGPQGAVVAAVHQAGMGEVVYLGTDDFVSLRASGKRLDERFWAGTVRYLAAVKQSRASETITVETDRDRYRQNEQVRLFVHRAGGSADERRLEVFVESDLSADERPVRGRPAPGATAEAVSRVEDGAPSLQRWRVNVFPDAGLTSAETKEGRFTGVLRIDAPGRYKVVLDGEEKTSFEVAPLASEWQDPEPDFELLEEIATRTGGSFLRLAELAELPARVPDGSVTEIVGRRATTVWDSAVLMVLFAALLSLEWTLRKLWNLN